MNYILVGTYKTKPESEGWYVNNSRYRILWEKLNNKFESKYSHHDCVYNSEKNILGEIKGLNNFFFYDLKPYDFDQKGETKDSVVYNNSSEDFISGMFKLLEEVKSRPKEFFRFGLQGNNTVGLLLNYLNTPERLKEVKLSSLAKDWKNINFGRIKDIIKCPVNLQMFKIYNLTQPARKKEDLHNLFNKTWDDFLNLK